MTRQSEPIPCEDGRSLLRLLERAAAMVADLGPEYDHGRRRLLVLKDRLIQGRFHLAVLGQFKRGKSTLLNALTGEAILPVGVVPLTAVPTFIQFGKAPKIRVHCEGGRKVDEFIGGSTHEMNTHLSRFVTEEGNPQNRLNITEVQVDMPSRILAGGVVLIDTPGIGSTYKHNTLATLNFLQQCDAALFLISADPPITEVELEFLQQVRQKVPRLFFVFNKIDYLDEGELNQAISFYKRVLTEHACWEEESPVFCVSARRGMEARLAGDPTLWTASGLAQLESFLVDFLAHEKFNALSDAISHRALVSVEVVSMEAAIAVQALKLPQKVLEEKITLFEASLNRAARERTMIQDVLEGDKKRITAFLEEQARILSQKAESFLRDIMNSDSRHSGTSSKASIQEAWAKAIPEFFGQQQATLKELVETRLKESLSPHEERLTRLVETLRHAAADLFQVPYRPLQQEEILKIQRRPYLVLNTWSADPLPFLKSMNEKLNELVLRNVENIRWAMLQNLNVSFAQCASLIKNRLEETIAATKGAMEAAALRRKAQGGTVASEVARLSNRIAELERFKVDLARYQRDSSMRT